MHACDVRKTILDYGLPIANAHLIDGAAHPGLGPTLSLDPVFMISRTVCLAVAIIIVIALANVYQHRRRHTPSPESTAAQHVR